jgi:hypothetical protein
MHDSFVIKSNLHIRLLFVLNTSVATQRYILFFHLEQRIVPLRTMPNGIVRRLIDFIYIMVCIIDGGIVRELSSRAPTDFEICFCLSARFQNINDLLLIPRIKHQRKV